MFYRSMRAKILPDVIKTAISMRLLDRTQALEQQRQLVREIEAEIAELRAWSDGQTKSPQLFVEEPERIQPKEASTKKIKGSPKVPAKVLLTPEQIAHKRALATNWYHKTHPNAVRRTPKAAMNNGSLDADRLPTGKTRAILGESEREAAMHNRLGDADPLHDHVALPAPTAEQAEYVSSANIDSATASLPRLSQRLKQLEHDLSEARSHANNTIAEVLSDRFPICKPRSTSFPP